MDKKYGRWNIVGDPIGQGGQGTVYPVTNIDKDGIAQTLGRHIQHMRNADALAEKDRQEIAKAIARSVKALNDCDENGNWHALKEFFLPHGGEDFDKTKKRIKDGLQAMSEIEHPNLLKVTDKDLNEKWFVTKYYSKGTLDKIKSSFTGQVLKTLYAIRPIVDGVSKLHDKGVIHRDIKPQNIFIGDNDEFILGDFGLVFFEANSNKTRYTGTFESVGSSHWMPTWAFSMYLDDVKPSFDVFCLGKVIYSMVSKSPILRLHYLHDSEFELTKMFPDDEKIALLYQKILDKCIVERSENCLPNASALLGEIINTINIIERDGKATLTSKTPLYCVVCKIGTYQDPVGSYTSADYPKGPYYTSNIAKICNYCGNMQSFESKSGGDTLRPAWKTKKS